MLSPIAISDYLGAFEKIFPIVIVPVTSLSFAEIVPFNNVRLLNFFSCPFFLFVLHDQAVDSCCLAGLYHLLPIVPNDR
jgi:hypothetical protein